MAFPSLDEQLRGAKNNAELQKELIALDNLKRKAENEGINPSLLEPRDSLFMQGLDLLDTPKQWVQGVLDAAFVRQDLFDVGLFGAAARGADEDISGADILRRSGLESPIARGVLGFGLDVLTDPLTLAGGSVKGLSRTGAGWMSKEGSKVVGEMTQNIMQRGMAMGASEGAAYHIASNQVDEAFQGLGGLVKTLKKFKGADKGEKMLLASEAVGDLKLSKPILEHMGYGVGPMATMIRNNPDDAYKTLSSLFKPKGLSFEVGLPFLGHLQGKDSYKFIEGEGAVRKTLKTIGNIVKPGRLELASVDTQQARKGLEAIGAFDALYGSVKSAATTSIDAMKKIAQMGDTATDAIPFVKGGKDKVKVFTNAIGTSAKKMFAKELLPGANKQALQARDDFIAARNSFDDISKGVVLEKFPASFNPETSQAARAITGEAALAIDHAGMSLFEDLKEGFKSKSLPKEWEERLLDGINRISLGLGDDFTFNLPEVDNMLRAGFEEIVTNPNTPEGVRDAMRTTLSHFDDLIAKEKALGIDVGFLDSYLPHVYNNIRHGKVKGVAGGGSFVNSRHYSSLSEALEKGLLGRTDLEGLVAYRTRQSLLKRAEKEYFIKNTLHAGLSEKSFKRLFLMADTDPLVAKALQKRGLPTPSVWTPEQIEQANEIFSVGAKYEGMAAEGFRKASVRNVDEVTKDLISRAVEEPQLAFDFINQDNAGLIHNVYKDLENKIGKSFAKYGGKKTFEEMRPSMLQAELGRQVTELNGSKFYLPDSMAKMYEETVANRDRIREMFGTSEAGAKFLDLLDSGLNFVKKTVTLPFPSYWMRNLFGDGLFRVMDTGIDALDPGHMANTYNLLRGKEGLKTASGVMIDPHTFGKILDQAGIRMNEKAFLELVGDGSGVLDVDKFLLKQKGIKGSLLAKKPGVALELAQERMRNNFENFFRVNHLAQRLKMGDTIPEAIRHTNDTLINYSDLTEIERSFFRRAYMFWGWTSKASKKAVGQLLRNPGDITMQLHAARGVSELFSEPDAAPTADEIGVKTLHSLNALEQIAFPLGRDNEGKVLMGRGFGLPIDVIGQNLSVYLPRNFSAKELTDAFDDSFVRTLQKQAAQANPILKNTVEKISGKNLFFDVPLDAKFLRRLPTWEKLAEAVSPHAYNKIPKAVARQFDNATLAILGGGRDSEGNLYADPGRYWWLTQTIPGIARLVGTARDLTRPDVPLAQKVTEQFSGLRVSSQDVSRSLAHRTKREIEEQRKEQRLYN